MKRSKRKEKIALKEIEAWAAEIWQLAQNDDLYKRVINNIYLIDLEKEITNASELKEWIDALEGHIRERSTLMSKELTLPILVQMISDFYYGHFESRPFWMGTTLKSTIAYIWGTTPTEKDNEFSLEKLAELILFVTFIENFKGLLFVACYSDIHIEIRKGRIRYSEETKLGMAEYNLCFEGRGRLHRTIEHSTSAIWFQLDKALIALENVINGEPPSQQLAFQETIFARIPDREPVEFWEGIWVRLQLIRNCYKRRASLGLNAMGTLLFDHNNIPVPPNADIIGMSNQIKSTIWEQYWYDTSNELSFVNMLVDRPVLTISNNTIYATSVAILIDSLNSFIESSIMKYDNSVNLSETCFKQLISTPFEQAVKAKLKKYGYKVGSVIDSNKWIVDDEDTIVLGNINNVMIPGEIDVLAYHPTKRHILIVECKVISFPYTRNRMRNIIQKFRSTSRDSYYGKLNSKIEWIKRADLFIQEENRIEGLIVLDRKLPGMDKGVIPILDMDSIDGLLEESKD